MKKLILVNAIVWAFLILLSAYLFKNNEHYNYFFIALIVCFTILNTFLEHYRIVHKKTSCLK